MKQPSISSQAILKITIACAWGVATVALGALSLFGIGDRENVLGLLCLMLALGIVVGVHTFRTSVREKEALEQALQKSQEQLRRLMESHPHAMSMQEK